MNILSIHRCQIVLFFMVIISPFKECQIEMVLDKTEGNSVLLVGDGFQTVQSADMNLFLITESRLVNMSNSQKGVKMEVKLKRKITTEMMTTYLPSLLLMMITFATTFFKPFFFEAALSVNLTTMLVMTTIFISKMEGLPPTSDIKMIDIWLILCQLVPFAQVVLITAIEFLREEEGQKEEQISTKEEFIQTEPTNDNQKGSVQFEVEDEPKPKEAWTIAATTPSKIRFVPMLAVIGRFLVVEKLGLKPILFREESATHECTLCLLRLLWNCCNFLFRLNAFKSSMFADPSEKKLFV